MASRLPRWVPEQSWPIQSSNFSHQVGLQSGDYSVYILKHKPRYLVWIGCRYIRCWLGNQHNYLWIWVINLLAISKSQASTNWLCITCADNCVNEKAPHFKKRDGSGRRRVLPRNCPMANGKFLWQVLGDPQQAQIRDKFAHFRPFHKLLLKLDPHFFPSSCFAVKGIAFPLWESFCQKSKDEKSEYTYLSWKSII